MAHLVLPDSGEARNSGNGAKFVDKGIPLLLERMEELGAARTRIVFKMAGGAHMLTAPGLDGRFNIGERNVEAAMATLSRLGLRLKANDTGGNRGRTVRFHVGSGRLTVSTAGEAACEL
jgi:chemotaxis protein CheD